MQVFKAISKEMTILKSLAAYAVAGVVFTLLALYFAPRIIFNDRTDDWWFDSQIWKSEAGIHKANKRAKMLVNLEKHVLKVGMNKLKVKEILGLPDAGVKTNKWNYNAGWWGALSSGDFIVEFNAQGKVKSFYRSQHPLEFGD